MIALHPGLVLALLVLAGCGREPEAPMDKAAPPVSLAVLAAMQISHSWGVASSSGDGQTELIRYRQHADSIREAALHPQRLMVTWTYDRFPPSGRETQDVDKLEDDLCGLLEPANQALLWLVRTGGGTRRWIFYGTSTDEMTARVKRVRELVASRGAVLSVDQDPGWQMYREFTPR